MAGEPYQFKAKYRKREFEAGISDPYFAPMDISFDDEEDLFRAGASRAGERL